MTWMSLGIFLPALKLSVTGTQSCKETEKLTQPLLLLRDKNDWSQLPASKCLCVVINNTERGPLQRTCRFYASIISAMLSSSPERRITPNRNSPSIYFPIKRILAMIETVTGAFQRPHSRGREERNEDHLPCLLQIITHLAVSKLKARCFINRDRKGGEALPIKGGFWRRFFLLLLCF